MGKYPFEPAAGKTKLDFFDIFHCIVQQGPPRLPRDRFSEELCDFIDQCLVKEPELRPNAAKLLVCQPYWVVILRSLIQDRVVVCLCTVCALCVGSSVYPKVRERHGV